MNNSSGCKKSQKNISPRPLVVLCCILASPGQLGPLGSASHSAPTVNDEPGGFVLPDADNPPWAAVDGNPATHVHVNGPASTFPWWELEFQCTETVTAVHLTSSNAGDPGELTPNQIVYLKPTQLYILYMSYDNYI